MGGGSAEDRLWSSSSSVQEDARHVTGQFPGRQALLLVQLQRQAIRIGEEGEAFAGEGVDADGFTLYAMRVEMLHGLVDVIHAKGEMT